jgi:hypothetical protein
VSNPDARREFDQIVGRLAAEDPSLARPVRMISRRAKLSMLAALGAMVWGGLSVLMVVWGVAGVVFTCIAVAVAAGVGVLRSRRSAD